MAAVKGPPGHVGANNPSQNEPKMEAVVGGRTLRQAPKSTIIAAGLTAPKPEHVMLRTLFRTITRAMAAPEPTRVPIPKNGVDYRGCVVLAPMVRSGELPSRLLALKYGADLVWGRHSYTTMRCDGMLTHSRPRDHRPRHHRHHAPPQPAHEHARVVAPAHEQTEEPAP